jgi:hypothetical protein
MREWIALLKGILKCQKKKRKCRWKMQSKSQRAEEGNDVLVIDVINSQLVMAARKHCCKKGPQVEDKARIRQNCPEAPHL